MGNITSRQARPLNAAEVAARIAARLDAEIVELYAVRDGSEVDPVARWTVPGVTTPGSGSVALAWFPWSLGNIRPQHYLFVRNAGALPLRPDDGWAIGDLGINSALHLPIQARPTTTIGAVCAYWVDERSSWEEAERDVVCSWALDVLESADRRGFADRPSAAC